MQKICLVILRKLLAVPVLSFLTHKAGGLQYMSCRFLSSHTHMFPHICLLRLAMCSWHCIKHKGKEGLFHQRTFTLLSHHLLSQACRTANGLEQMTLLDTACKAQCLIVEEQQLKARDARDLCKQEVRLLVSCRVRSNPFNNVTEPHSGHGIRETHVLIYLLSCQMREWPGGLWKSLLREKVSRPD